MAAAAVLRGWYRRVREECAADIDVTAGLEVSSAAEDVVSAHVDSVLTKLGIPAADESDKLCETARRAIRSLRALVDALQVEAAKSEPAGNALSLIPSQTFEQRGAAQPRKRESRSGSLNRPTFAAVEPPTSPNRRSSNAHNLARLRLELARQRRSDAMATSGSNASSSVRRQNTVDPAAMVFDTLLSDTSAVETATAGSRGGSLLRLGTTADHAQQTTAPPPVCPIRPMRTHTSSASVHSSLNLPEGARRASWSGFGYDDQVVLGGDAAADFDDACDAEEAPAADAPSRAVRVTRQATTSGAGGDGSRSDTDSDASFGASGDIGGVIGELNQFVLLDRLGRGSQGEVFLALDNEVGVLRAIKAVNRPVPGVRVSEAWRRKLDDLAREISIMRKLRHRNIVALHEIIDDERRDKMYLVLQCVEGGAIAKMSDDGRSDTTIDPKQLVNYASQMTEGLRYLHRHGVIHRDIKPENILKGNNDDVYLADFGVSEAFDSASTPAERRIRGTRGTPAFLAPELLKLRICDSGDDDGAATAHAAGDVNGEAVDVWALGITLYALLYGRIPWEFSNARDLFEAIQQRPIELRPAAAASRSMTSFSVQGASVVVSASTAPPPMSVERKGSLVEPMPLAAVAAGTLHQSAQHMPPLAFAEFNADADSDPQSDDDDTGIDGRARPPAALLHSAGGGDLPRPGQFLSSPQWHASMSSIGGPFAVTSYLDEAWRQLLHSMLQRDPRRRATVAQVLNDLRRMSKRADEASMVPASPGPVANVFTKLR